LISLSSRISINLSYEIDNEDLEEIFSEIGVVEQAVVMKDATGKSRGFGIVVMARDHDVSNSVSNLNGSIQKGIAIEVSED